MRRNRVRSVFLLAVLAAACSMWSPASAAPRAPADSLARAKLLVGWAREALVTPTLASRELAIRHLRKSLALRPGDAEAWLLLGLAQEMGEYGRLARQCFRTATRLNPDDPEAWLCLGRSWKRAWLRTLDPAARDSAAASFAAATRVRPRAADGWLGLVPLRYEQGDAAGAEVAAARALDGFPRRAEALLAVGYMSYRNGDLERADSCFQAALPRLDPTVRELFEHPQWIGLSANAGRAGQPAASAWEGLDPDPTTPVNELELEYETRVAHACLLFGDPLHPELDSRASTYVRYGPPAAVQFNPAGSPMTVEYTNLKPGRDHVASSFPADAQVWSYPQLGMQVVLQDRSLLGHYTPPARAGMLSNPTPDRRMLAARSDLVSLGDGFVVFPTLPPRDQQLELRATTWRFPGAGSTRMVTHVQAGGSPSDSLWTRWVVLDAQGRELGHDARLMGLSACDPAARRVGEFSYMLPEGAYEVVVSSRDQHRRRGLVRMRVGIDADPPGLALSDIVLVCGDPAQAVNATSLRLEGNLDATVRGTRPLAAYFELDHLKPGANGRGRFEYEYTVHLDTQAPGKRTKQELDLGAAPLVAATREEQTQGSLRRQFVTVPTQRLPEGRYVLKIRVRDLETGEQAERSIGFVRD